MESPIDGVFYPGVSTDIPEAVRVEIIARLEIETGRKVTCNFMFLRLSVEGVKAPHAAHTDCSHGALSLMLYLNKLDDCEGGTAFVSHKKTGLNETPINNKQLETWRADTKSEEAWAAYNVCHMLPNRALVFSGKMMHMALPTNGFGQGAKDGRLVLTMFFDVA